MREERITITINEDGSLKETEVYGKKYHGRKLYDTLDSYVRKGFFALDEKDLGEGIAAKAEEALNG